MILLTKSIYRKLNRKISEKVIWESSKYDKLFGEYLPDYDFRKKTYLSIRRKITYKLMSEDITRASWIFKQLRIPILIVRTELRVMK